MCYFLIICCNKKQKLQIGILEKKNQILNERENFFALYQMDRNVNKVSGIFETVPQDRFSREATVNKSVLNSGSNQHVLRLLKRDDESYLSLLFFPNKQF